MPRRRFLLPLALVLFSLASLAQMPSTPTTGAVPPNTSPMDQFTSWFNQAMKNKVQSGHHFDLCTMSSDNQPTSRIMNLASYDNNGFVFYTHGKSMKAKHLAQNPLVAMTFYWPSEKRQINIQGKVQTLTTAQMEQDFAKLDRSIQLKKWVSETGAPIESKTQLKQKYAELKKTYANKKIPMPPHFQGYLVVPSRVLFWEASTKDHLNDRTMFSLANGKWTHQVLAP